MEAAVGKHRFRHEREKINSPSFSSSLLDAIYRSIDDDGRGDQEEEEELVLYRETMRRKKHTSNFAEDDQHQHIADIRRACLIEKWMEKKVSEKVVVRRKSAADFPRKSRNDRDSMFFHSSSSSSDSSCTGGFSSSEAESVYGVSSHPKPVRTCVSSQQENKFSHGSKCREVDQIFVSSQQKSKHEDNFIKTKSRALKIYGDLKKVKQPISPGGRLASFLNSLFTPANTKKAKISSSEAYDDASNLERKSKSAHASTCSSASSFSRSCLSKTPSSRGKASNGMKRSVRFDPVSVIVDEDCQPCGHKSLYGDEYSKLPAVKFGRDQYSVNEELKVHLSEKNRRVEEAARNLLKNYQKKVECEFDLRNANSMMNGDDESDDDDDDAASYASSDLFELDNLSAIGMERYREELPVYGTTHLDTLMA